MASTAAAGASATASSNGANDTRDANEAAPGARADRPHRIGPGALVTPALSGREAEQWALLVKVLGPERVVAKLASVKFYNRPADSSDAAVVRTTGDPARFDVEINLARTNEPRAQAFTYIHEFAHTLTLSGDQVPEISGSCPRLRIVEGCALPTSYLEQWQTSFWAPYGSSAPTGADDDERTSAAFYAAHPADFVTEYAATNVTEDYAETFATWVMDQPPTTGLAAKKVALLETYPELRSLREALRANVEPDWLG